MKIKGIVNYHTLDWETKFSQFLVKHGLSERQSCPGQSHHTGGKGEDTDFTLTLGVPKDNGFRLILASCWHNHCKDAIENYMINDLGQKWSKFIGHTSEPRKVVTSEEWEAIRREAYAKVEVEEQRQKAIDDGVNNLLSKLSSTEIPSPVFTDISIDFGWFITRFWRPSDIIFLGNRFQSAGHLFYADLEKFQKHKFLVSPEQISPFVYKDINGARKTSNTTERRYMVLEMDDSPIQHQWDMLNVISREVSPLLMVVHTGGKSLHGWFRPSELFTGNGIFYTALGYDDTSFHNNQLCRMPGVMRKLGLPKPVEQRIIWIDKNYHI